MRGTEVKGGASEPLTGLGCLAESAGQQAPQRPKTKQEEIMEREKADKKQIAEQEAAAKAAEAKKHGRKDEPWLHVGVVVKVRRSACPGSVPG